MDKYDIDPTWRVVILDNAEWKLFIDGRNRLNCYKNEFFEFADVVEEYDEEIDTYNACANVSSCPLNNEYFKLISEELDQKRLEAFNYETKFIQRLFRSYDVDHLILINDESFSTLLSEQRPEILTHEAFHIVEDEFFEQNHKFEEVHENAIELAEQYIASLTGEERKRECKKISSHRKGRGKYGRLRLITKF
jgi:hypothetical protein